MKRIVRITTPSGSGEWVVESDDFVTIEVRLCDLIRAGTVRNFSFTDVRPDTDTFEAYLTYLENKA